MPSKSTSQVDAQSTLRCVPASIAGIQTLTPSSKLVRLKIRGDITFFAGQYVCLYHERPSEDGTIIENPEIFPGTYSVASSPSQLPFVEVAVQDSNNPRNLRNYLYRTAKVGDTLWCDRLGYGAVAITPQMLSCPLAWNGGSGGICLLAGGFGIPSLVSIAKYLCQPTTLSNIPDITLLHSVRVEDEIPFFNDIKQMERDNANFTAIHTVTRATPAWDGRRGRIDDDLLKKIIPGKQLFCVLGSGEFVRGIVDMLLQLGVWAGNIRSDYSTRVDTSALCVKTVDEKCEMQQAMFISKGKTKSSEYLERCGMSRVLELLETKIVDQKPANPLSFSIELLSELKAAQGDTPEVVNECAADPQFWINYWEGDAVTWHSPEVSPWLVELKEELLSKDSQKKRIFVPLSGKSVDMRYLLSEGHEVIGADCSGVACVDFFMEHRIPGYERVEVSDKIVLHRSTIVPLRLFEGDIFELTPEVVGQVDCILDRAALVALHPSCVVPKYLPLLTSLLAADGKMLIASVSKLPEAVAPPHCYTTNQIENVLSQGFLSICHKMDYCYKLHAGEVVEPIYIVSQPKKTTRTTAASAPYIYFC